MREVMDREIAAVSDATLPPVERARRVISKVPQVTVSFWIVKVLTTGMGETASDYLLTHMNPLIAIALMGIGLIAALALQLAVRHVVVWIYWSAVAMVAIFGTMLADVLHFGLGIPDIVTTAVFAAALVAVLIAWHMHEHTLSIHHIDTRPRELFYWATVMASFALGTAAGDLTARGLGLGFLLSGVLFAVLFATPPLAHRLFGLNAVVAFWSAYIITRPLGASFADWIGQSHAQSGLGVGTGGISIVLTLVIIGLVGYLSVTHRDRDGEDEVQDPRPSAAASNLGPLASPIRR